MKNIKNSQVTREWLEIKEYFETNSNKEKEFEYGENFPLTSAFRDRCINFIELLGEITVHRPSDEFVLEGVRMRVWKERIWVLYDKAGFLVPASMVNGWA